MSDWHHSDFRTALPYLSEYSKTFSTDSIERSTWISAGLTVSHNVLSDYVSFHSMYIEETLHKTDSPYFFIGGNCGIGTSKYTKAILIYMNFILGST